MVELIRNKWESTKSYHKRKAQKKRINSPGRVTRMYMEKTNPEPLQFPDEMLLDTWDTGIGIRRKFRLVFNS